MKKASLWRECPLCNSLRVIIAGYISYVNKERKSNMVNSPIFHGILLSPSFLSSQNLLRGAELKVLLSILETYEFAEKLSRIDCREIGQRTGFTLRTVMKTLNSLENKEILTIQREKGKVNTYSFSPGFISPFDGEGGENIGKVEKISCSLVSS